MQRRSQHGFLIIIPLILIVVIGMLGAVVAYIYTDTATSVSSIVASNQAFYIATSGLEAAKRDLIVNNVNCTAINATNPTYTNVPLFNGYYSVNGTLKTASSSLAAGGIPTSTATYIPLTSSTNFLTSSIVKVDSEIIMYFGKSGNSLINAIRGIGGTTPVAHPSGTATQNICVLTSTAGVPNLSKSTGKRTVQQQVMLGYGGSMGLPTNPLPLGITPALIANGGINVQASATINNVAGSGLGCAITAVGGVSFQGSAYTLLCSGITDPLRIWASGYNNPPNPWQEINTSSLHGYFFSLPLSTMMDSNHAVQAFSFTPTAINNAAATAIAQGKSVVYYQGGSNPSQGTYLTNISQPITLVINQGVSIGSNRTFGDATHPVIVYVQGGFSQSGNGSINGFLYVNGGATFQTSSFVVNGAVAVNGGVTFKNSVINFNTALLQQLGFMSGTPPIVSTPEVFK